MCIANFIPYFFHIKSKETSLSKWVIKLELMHSRQNILFYLHWSTNFISKVPIIENNSQYFPLWYHSQALGTKEDKYKFDKDSFLELEKHTFSTIRGDIRDFPGGAVVKNPPANAGDTGSSPGPGRSHMPQSN